MYRDSCRDIESSIAHDSPYQMCRKRETENYTVYTHAIRSARVYTDRMYTYERSCKKRRHHNMLCMCVENT